jgi:hypothetical protein
MLKILNMYVVQLVNAIVVEAATVWLYRCCCLQVGVHRCACGAETAKLPCWQADWHCAKPCGKTLKCQRHKCEQVSLVICHILALVLLHSQLYCHVPCFIMLQQQTCPTCGRQQFTHPLPYLFAVLLILPGLTREEGLHWCMLCFRCAMSDPAPACHASSSRNRCHCCPSPVLL